MNRPSGLFSKLSQAKVIGFVPPVAWSLLFFATPLAVMVLYSFWTYVDYRVESTWTFENYQDFFTRSTFHSALKNSAILTILTVVLSVVLAYPVAYGIAFKIPKRFQILVLITLIIPFWTSYVIRSYSWLTVLSENGIVNKFPDLAGNHRNSTGLGVLKRNRDGGMAAFLHNVADIHDIRQPWSRLAPPTLGRPGTWERVNSGLSFT